MTIKPIGKRILVKPLKMEEKTSSGIILPGSENQTVPNIGDVIAVGDLEEIKLGERIIYEKYSGTEIVDSGEKYLILKIENVLAVAEKK